MRLTNRGFGVFLALALLLAPLAGLPGCAAAPAEKYPSKPIRVLVPVAAGGVIDVMARTIAKGLESSLKVAAPVENKTGGAGIAALTDMKGQPADGYTIIFGTSDSTPFVLASSQGQIVASDLEAVLNYSRQAPMVVVKADSQFKSFEELLQFAKANPGKLKFGGVGATTGVYAAFKQWTKLAGVEMTWVAFDSAPLAMTAVLGGHIDLSYAPMAVAGQHIKAGTARALVTLGDDPDPLMSNIPTLKSKGINFSYYNKQGVSLKAGTPPDRVKVLHDAIKKIVESDEFKASLTSQGLEPKYEPGEPITKALPADVELATEILKQAGR